MFNLKDGSEEHFSSIKSMFIKLDELGLQLKSFDDIYINSFRSELLTNAHVNKSAPRDCNTYF